VTTEQRSAFAYLKTCLTACFKNHQKELTVMRENLKSAVISQINIRCPQGDNNLTIDEQTRLDELVMDSLELLELIYTLEEQFSIQTDEKLMSELQTVGDITAMLEQACVTEPA
jgi:acyl carrier protein